MNSNSEQFALVDKLLKVLDTTGLLKHLIFVGSWCIYFYKHHFKDPLLPSIRTTDIDVDVNPLLKVRDCVHIPELLQPLDFEIIFAGDNFIFLVNPSLKIEFLSPEKGRGSDEPLRLPNFGITAQPLRFLDLLEKEVITVEYKGMNIRVPHPVWFGVHKLIISQRRRSGIANKETGEEGKSHKDVIQGIEVLSMADRMGLFDKITSAIGSLTKKQRKLLIEQLTSMMIMWNCLSLKFWIISILSKSEKHTASPSLCLPNRVIYDLKFFCKKIRFLE